jgi:transcriptional regulator with XRE-family HTH domain
MKHCIKTFPKALKEIMDKKDIIHRKLAAKTNFSFSYFCVLKKRKGHPPVETIKKIAQGLEIPPEYFLEYRINKLVKILIDNPNITDCVLDFAKDLVESGNSKVNDKEK